MDFAKLQTDWSPRLLSVLRIMSALLFMEHGTQKLLGFPALPQMEITLLSLVGIAGLLELVGGALLALGLFTRPVAFILSARWRSPISWRTRRKTSSRFSMGGTGRFCTASSSSISPPLALAPGRWT